MKDPESSCPLSDRRSLLVQGLADALRDAAWICPSTIM